MSGAPLPAAPHPPQEWWAAVPSAPSASTAAPECPAVQSGRPGTALGSSQAKGEDPSELTVLQYTIGELLPYAAAAEVGW